MKKRGNLILIFILLLIIAIGLVSVNAVTITFNAFNAPWEHQGKTCVKAPVLIDSSLTPGEKINISGINGYLCELRGGGRGCVNDSKKGCNSLYKLNCATSSKAKIGFYNSGINILVQEVPLNSFVNGVFVPLGADSMYAYLHDDSDNPANNNGGFNCGFTYIKNIPCVPKNCTELGKNCGDVDNTCGLKMNCGTCNNIGQYCNAGVCSDVPPLQQCSPGQTIMRLYQQNNSHAALWDSLGPSFDICYDNIFGENFTGTNPNECNGENLVLRLAQINNSHAENLLNDVYTVDVCYGNLKCRTADSCNSLSNEKAIVELSSNTNAHVSDAVNFYPIKVCCIADAEGNASWNDMMNRKISNANISDTVKLVVNKARVEGKEVSYTIYKPNDFFWFFDRKIAQLTGAGYITWKINNSGDFYFKATIPGSGSVMKSGDLHVTEFPENDLPQIEITSPLPGSNITIDKNTNKSDIIDFTADIYDSDDDLSLKWDFGDGKNITFLNCLTNTSCNANHVYENRGGTKTVIATIREMSRTNPFEVKDYSRIFVFKEGLNIFSIIDRPYYREPIREAGYFYIDGTSSYVSNCSFNEAQCNSASNGAGKGNCYPVNDSLNLSDSSKIIYCYRFASSDRLGFKWIFDGVVDNEHTNSTPFIRLFQERKEHIINLKVNFSY